LNCISTRSWGKGAGRCFAKSLKAEYLKYNPKSSHGMPSYSNIQRQAVAFTCCVKTSRLESSWTFSKTFSIKDRNLSILGKLWAVHYPYAHPAQFVPTRRPGIRRLSASQHSVVLFDGKICQFSLRFSGGVKFPNCFRTSVFSASAPLFPNFSPQRFDSTASLSTFDCDFL
jgi:hypothetical protein